MSTPSENQELEFAWALRRALDESAAHLTPATTKRLAAARQAALARRKPEPEMAVAPVFAVAGMGVPGDGMFGVGSPRSSRRAPLAHFFSRFALTWPCVALVAGIFLIAHWENQQRAAELADIDAAMLSDDLPLHAYLDHGFNAYLSRAR